jgi:NADH-quinone oxidoreductase subunit K
MTSLFANILTQPVGVAHYLVVGAVLFVCGALCMATKRNAIGVLLGIELVLNGANLNFIAFGSRYLRDSPGIGLDGQLMSLFVIVLAAAEAAVALAIALNFYNSFNSIDVDQADQLQG